MTMANPQKKHKSTKTLKQAATSNPFQAGMEEYAQMQKHQTELFEWLMQTDNKETRQFLNKQYPFVR